MTLDEIARRVQHISDSSEDNEVAHAYEDDLHQDVLCAIAKGECDDPAAAAALAISTLEIGFTRWYA